MTLQAVASDMANSTLKHVVDIVVNVNRKYQTNIFSVYEKYQRIITSIGNIVYDLSVQNHAQLVIYLLSEH